MNQMQPDIAFLASIVESSNDAIISKTLDFIVLTWNVGAERLYGYTAAEMVGQPISILFPPEKEAEEEQIRQRLLKGETLEHYETERITKAGRRIFVSVTISPILDTRGVVIGASAIARDITERKRGDVERLLLASIVDSSDDAIIGKNAEGFITSWNKGAERLYGYSADEAIGQPVSLLMPPERIDDFPQIMSRIRNGERVERYETLRQRKDGSRLDVSLTVSPIRDDIGNIIGASAIARDITERKRAEIALLRSEQQFRRVVDTAPGAILLIDQSGKIVLVNERSGTLFGYSLDELLGMSVDVLLPDQFREDHAAYRHAYFEQPGVRSMGIGRELAGLRKDGTEFPVEIGLSYIHTESGMLALAFVTDITERVRAEEERSRLLMREQAAYAEAQRTKIEERDRISMELHDGIIQSIYAVGMTLEIARTRHISDSDLNTALVNATKDLNHIIEDLRRYIHDLKAEGNVPYEFQPQVQDLARKFEAASSARLVIDIPEQATFASEEDAHAVVQLLREALSNIARHANATEVHVVLQESPSSIVMRISDNGVGFDSANVKLGNGLNNMRQRVEQLNGTLDIVSQLHQGTTLTFMFPRM